MTLDGFTVVFCGFTGCTDSISRNKNNNFLQCILYPYSPIRAFTQCHSKQVLVQLGLVGYQRWSPRGRP